MRHLKASNVELALRQNSRQASTTVMSIHATTQCSFYGDTLCDQLWSACKHLGPLLIAMLQVYSLTVFDDI